MTRRSAARAEFDDLAKVAADIARNEERDPDFYARPRPESRRPASHAALPPPPDEHKPRPFIPVDVVWERRTRVRRKGGKWGEWVNSIIEPVNHMAIGDTLVLNHDITFEEPTHMKKGDVIQVETVIRLLHPALD